MLLTFLFFFMRAAVAMSVSLPQIIRFSLIVSPLRCPIAAAHLLFFFPQPPRNYKNVQLASLRLQISMNCLISETSEGILAEVDEFGSGRCGGRIVVNRELLTKSTARLVEFSLAQCTGCRGAVWRERPMGKGAVTTCVARDVGGRRCVQLQSAALDILELRNFK
jgi:hypothetical protein